jgi:rhodanese-related sulfurtransferase
VSSAVSAALLALVDQEKDKPHEEIAVNDACCRHSPETSPSGNRMRTIRRWAPSEAKVLTRAEFEDLLAKAGQVLLIDVRRPDEVKDIRGFPACFSIQIGDLDKSLAWIPRERTIVTISNHATRVPQAADILAKNALLFPDRSDSRSPLEEVISVRSIQLDRPKRRPPFTLCPRRSRRSCGASGHSRRDPSEPNGALSSAGAIGRQLGLRLPGCWRLTFGGDELCAGRKDALFSLRIRGDDTPLSGVSLLTISPTRKSPRRRNSGRSCSTCFRCKHSQLRPICWRASLGPDFLKSGL